MLYQSIGTANVTGASVLMAFTGDPQTLIPMIRRELQAVEPRLFVSIEPVATTIALESQRCAAVVKLAAIPASLAVFLSIIGIYGVTSFAVAQRRHEIGIRSALGAQPSALVSMLFLSLRWPFAGGLTFGILLAAIGSRLLQQANVIIDASLVSPWTYGSALLLLACAAGATCVPTLRATRAEPWHVLRND